MTTEGKHPARWLIAYNSISTSLWSIVLFNAIFLGLSLGQPLMFEKTNKITTAVQTLAVVEIINAATGVVRASFLNTLMQVYSRLLIVWGVWQLLPQSPSNDHWTCISVQIAWGCSEIIKYSYHVCSLKGLVPYWLMFARYTAFTFLYPIGVGSEMYILYLSLPELKAIVGDWYYYFIVVNLVVYVPCLYHLYTHLLRQRKKVLGKYHEEQNKKAQ